MDRWLCLTESFTSCPYIRFNSFANKQFSIYFSRKPTKIQIHAYIKTYPICPVCTMITKYLQTWCPQFFSYPVKSMSQPDWQLYSYLNIAFYFPRSGKTSACQHGLIIVLCEVQGKKVHNLYLRKSTVNLFTFSLLQKYQHIKHPWANMPSCQDTAFLQAFHKRRLK